MRNGGSKDIGSGEAYRRRDRTIDLPPPLGFDHLPSIMHEPEQMVIELAFLVPLLLPLLLPQLLLRVEILNFLIAHLRNFLLLPPVNLLQSPSIIMASHSRSKSKGAFSILSIDTFRSFSRAGSRQGMSSILESILLTIQHLGKTASSALLRACHVAQTSKSQLPHNFQQQT